MDAVRVFHPTFMLTKEQVKQRSGSTNLLARLHNLEQLDDSAREALAFSGRQEHNEIQRALVRALGSDNKEVKVVAAYLLGEFRCSEAADSLARAITLADDKLHFSEPLWDTHPALEALIKIGNPSVPALIQNLSESDDPGVRAFSLTALRRIDDDKDISRLRLEKARMAQRESQKQARIQAALESLAQGPQ
jgi:HEAT repeat protein